MPKGRLMACPGRVRLTIHDPIPTVPAAEPDVRAVRALALRVREIVAAEAAAEPGSVTA